MRTLRRACAACAKAKHSCDLRTPKCSRCVKRNCGCLYANEPLTSPTAHHGDAGSGVQAPQAPRHHTSSGLITSGGENISADPSDMPIFFEAHLLDPFDSYPATNLPRIRVQGLMQHFLSKIAFQYYPLDLNPASNPFITSWWPLALTDPALFQVTLQTASWDDEFHARNGFPDSELLMKDSVSLLRHKVQHQTLAFQDATMNAVVTLAAIEYGKGNLHVSKMHIDGVKRMVTVRGGLSNVKTTSPLTARMVAWVSLLITGSPQFDTQDDSGRGDGVSTIQQWRRQVSKGHSESDLLDFDLVDIDPILANTVTRLRAVLGADRSSNGSVILSTTDLHDLTSFILHRLLSLPPFTNLDPQSISSSEGLRYGVLIYMLIIHGPTYYSHANILSALVLHLKYHLGQLLSSVGRHDFLPIWLLSVGALASLGTDEEPWFRGRCVEVSIPLGACRWDVIETYLKRVLWVQSSVPAFQHMWEDIIAAASSFSPEQHDQPDHFKGVA